MCNYLHKMSCCCCGIKKSWCSDNTWRTTTTLLTHKSSAGCCWEGCESFPTTAWLHISSQKSTEICEVETTELKCRSFFLLYIRHQLINTRRPQRKLTSVLLFSTHWHKLTSQTTQPCSCMLSSGGRPSRWLNLHLTRICHFNKP